MNNQNSLGQTESANAGWLDPLVRLRSKLFQYIQKSLEEDGHCKSYEGTFEIRMPSYFEDSHNPQNGDEWTLALHCYVIGPSRHYEWQGKTMAEAISKAEKDINQWCAEWDANSEQPNVRMSDGGHKTDDLH